MIPLIILGLLVGLPTLLVFILRSNAAVVFLAVCGGSILLKYVGGDASLVLSSFVPHMNIVEQDALKLTLLLLPAILTMLLLRRSLSGAKAFLNLLPAAATGALIALSVVPILSPSTSSTIMATNAWALLTRAQDLIIGAGVLLSLLLIWLSHKKSDKHTHDK